MGKLQPELHNRVAARRTERKLTQEQLARAANVSRQTIIAIEKGTYSPSTVLALRLAYLLNAAVDDLFYLPTTTLAELKEQQAQFYRSGEGREKNTETEGRV